MGNDLKFKSEASPVSAGPDDTLPSVFPTARVAKEIGNTGFTGTIGGLAVELGAHDIAYLQIDLGINDRIFDRDKKLRGKVPRGYQC